MSRMIPPIISDEEKRRSRAESDIFDWLRKMEWGDAIVMHSLTLKDHINKSFGEVDFIIICEMGVMCVEVKGGLVEFKDGMWGFTPIRSSNAQTNWKTEGPYKQVQGNMKSFRQYLERHLNVNDSILKCRWACCVMTPDCIVRSDDSIEVIPEISYDINMRPSDLPNFFTRCFKYWCEDKHYGGKESLGKKDRERLATLIRGDFSMIPPLSAVINKTEDTLMAVTTEQMEIISNMFENERMLIKGGAGTGKTLLATEQCRRFAAAGEKVLYLCFNSLISEYVSNVFKNDNTNGVSVYTFHELLMKIAGLSQVPSRDVDIFFAESLPKLFVDKMSKGDNQQFVFDRVIIDEGQDLLNEIVYNCIEYVIRDGWSQGKWSLYYDENQNVFGTRNEMKEIIELLRINAFTYPLTVNCRNTKQICSCNKAITLLPQPKILKADGEEVKYNPYSSKEEEAEKLFDSIRRIKGEGVLKRDIVILSSYRIDNPQSCLYERIIPSDIGKIRVNDKRFDFANDIRFYTIQSFKGLESKVVLIIDIDGFSTNEKVVQNYVGISRARSYLELFFDGRLKQERQERLVKSIVM